MAFLRSRILKILSKIFIFWLKSANLRISPEFYAIELQTQRTARRTHVRLRAGFYAISSHKTLFRPFCTIFLHPLFIIIFLLSTCIFCRRLCQLCRRFVRRKDCRGLKSAPGPKGLFRGYAYDRI